MIATAPDTWTAHFATPRGRRHWPCEELVRALADRQYGTVVEVGCGDGANLWFLTEHAETVIGIDNCAAALDLATATLLARAPGAVANVRHGDLQALPLPSASADLVVDVMASQHLSWADHGVAYLEYRRILRPGGRLFLYHLAAGTTIRGASLVGEQAWTHVPLFPEADLICLPPGWALNGIVKAAGFILDRPRALTRTYPQLAGDVLLAKYWICEGTCA